MIFDLVGFLLELDALCTFRLIFLHADAFLQAAPALDLLRTALVKHKTFLDERVGVFFGLFGV